MLKEMLIAAKEIHINTGIPMNIARGYLQEMDDYLEGWNMSNGEYRRYLSLVTKCYPLVEQGNHVDPSHDLLPF